MPAFYDTIILSPHLDDAVLSCGGQICLKVGAGQTVLIVSIMAGEPTQPSLSLYARSLHDRWQIPGEEAGQRRLEDIEAAQILGADYLHWNIPDCIYRRDPQSNAPYYISDDDIFGVIAASDRNLVGEIGALIKALPQFGQMFSPLGVGNHVDHQLTRAAAEEALGSNRLTYYEEYPYANQPGVLDRALGENRLSWEAQIVRLSEAALSTKIKAIAAYTSQLSTFFLDLKDLDRQVRQYAQLVGGERIWQYCHH